MSRMISGMSRRITRLMAAAMAIATVAGLIALAAPAMEACARLGAPASNSAFAAGVAGQQMLRTLGLN